MGEQKPVRIYAGVVGIAPQELKGIVAYLHVINSSHVLRHRVRVKTGPPGHLVNTIGAGATEAKVPKGEEATVPIIP